MRGNIIGCIPAYMAKYDRKDRFYMKAKADGRASRASYKLEQIDQKYKIFKKGFKVIDLGCAPGGWLEVASERVGSGGRVFGLDILETKTAPKENMVYVQADVNDERVLSQIKEDLGEVDLVLSDMAPDTSGIKFRDSYLSYELALRAFEIAEETLKKGGDFVTKIFPGEEFGDFKKQLQASFEKVVQYRPEATRKTSIEVYLIGKGFKG